MLKKIFFFLIFLVVHWAFLVAQWQKICLPIQEMWVWSLGWGDPGRKKWQLIPVFLPGKSHGQRNLEGIRSMGLQKSQTWLTDQITTSSPLETPEWMNTGSVLMGVFKSFLLFYFPSFSPFLLALPKVWTLPSWCYKWTCLDSSNFIQGPVSTFIFVFRISTPSEGTSPQIEKVHTPQDRDALWGTDRHSWPQPGDQQGSPPSWVFHLPVEHIHGRPSSCWWQWLLTTWLQYFMLKCFLPLRSQRPEKISDLKESLSLSLAFFISFMNEKDDAQGAEWVLYLRS